MPSTNVASRNRNTVRWVVKWCFARCEPLSAAEHISMKSYRAERPRINGFRFAQREVIKCLPERSHGRVFLMRENKKDETVAEPMFLPTFFMDDNAADFPGK